MSEDQDKAPSKRALLTKAIADASPAVRWQAGDLMEKYSMSLEQAADVAGHMWGMFKRGWAGGSRDALYANTPESFTGGEVVRVHKVNDLRIVEYVPTGGEEIRYTPVTEGVPGYPHTTFDAALLDAVAMKYDGNLTQAGYLMARMLGLTEDGK